MIEIDFENKSYICPYCRHAQAYYSSCDIKNNGDYANRLPVPAEYQESSFAIYTLHCRNASCKKICVTAINRFSQKQIDILPQVVVKHYPDCIPQQIKSDYEEASRIINSSPKASATLLRRCLQGMIHDFWNIYEKNLNAEITALKDKVTPNQWAALDGLRKLGNIGAHMEHDVNLMIDIEPYEAKKLLQLIELLFDKWYIAQHEEEMLLADITSISEEKENQRKA